MKELLEYLARALVDQPDRVQVEEFEEDDGTLVLELSVDGDDYGQVIGRGGRTAQALRAVVKAAAADDLAVVVVADGQLEHQRAVVLLELLHADAVRLVHQGAGQVLEQLLHRRARSRRA